MSPDYGKLADEIDGTCFMPNEVLDAVVAALRSAATLEKRINAALSHLDFKAEADRDVAIYGGIISSAIDELRPCSPE